MAEAKPKIRYADKVAQANAIAKPMASKKLAKKCYKLIKQANNYHKFVRKGLKDVQSRIGKGDTGIVIFAGDVFPIEIMCHLPIVCEDKNIPYVYVPNGKDLAGALGVKKGSINMVLIREHEDYKDQYDELYEEIKCLAPEDE